VSAKGRAVVDPLEYYPTPAWAIRPVVPFVGPASSIIDLGCGEGEIGSVLREAFPLARLVGIEIDAKRAAQAQTAAVYSQVLVTDVIAPLTSPLPPEYSSAFDLVIANPPFSNAVPFWEVACRLVRPGGTIAFLLRGVWAVPEERASVVAADEAPACDLLFLRRRAFPDSTEYAWTTWRPSDPTHGGRWRVLACESSSRSRRSPIAVVTNAR